MGAEDVFINYRGAADSLYAADLLHAELSHVLGPGRVFLDSESIGPGADFVQTIVDRVRGASIVLAVIGPYWLTALDPDGRRCIDDPRDWVRRELAEAFEAGVPVIPILTDNARMPTEADLPTDIAQLGRAQYALLRQRHARADIASLLDRLTGLVVTMHVRRRDAEAEYVSPPDPLARVADEFAKEVRARWRREEEHRRIQDPFPLPVRWQLAPEDLTDHWENICRASAGATSGLLDLTDQLDRVVNVYRRIPSGRLVVLGRAGSGKTILTLRFVLDLLRIRTGIDEVPVIFSVGSWNPTTTALREWLTGQLVRDYPGLAATGSDGSTLAAALVEGDRILPVLDGFDEIADGLHRSALEALNNYSSPLVLTSRRAEYADAVGGTDVLTAAAAIELVDLTTDDLTNYLPRTIRKATGPGTTTTVWDPVLDELRDHPHSQAGRNLTAVLTTPLMVALARTVYSDTPDHDPSTLLDTDRFPTQESIEDHLLGNFVPTVYRHRPDRRHRNWDTDRAQHWLGYLAQLGTRDLAWWQLGATMRRSSRALLIGVVVGLIVVFVQSLVYGLLLCLFDPPALRTLLTNSISVGGAAGLTFGLIFVIATAQRAGSLEPSSVRIRIRNRTKQARGQFVPRFRVGFVLGIKGGLIFIPTYELLSRLVFGLIDWLAFGITQSPLTQLALGLLNTAVWVIVFGTAAGVAAGLIGRFEAPLDVRSATSPADLLYTNRKTVFSQVLLFGPVFSLFLVVGSWLFVKLLPGQLTFALVTALDWGIAGPLAAGLGYIISLTAWGQWAIMARIWLPLTGRLPWTVLTFLDDAHQRGVLRQAGAVYQFRHARLQDHLARADNDQSARRPNS